MICKKTSHFLIFFILCFPIICFGNNKETYSWKPVNINGGGFTNFVVFDQFNQNVVYAGIDVGGIYKSVDGGEHWQPFNKGLIWSKDILAVAFLIDSKKKIFLGAGDYGKGGIFKRNTDTETWNLLTREIIFSSSKQRTGKNLIVQDPINAEIIYAGSCRDGVFKTKNYGESWKYIGLKGKYISSILIHPKNNKIIYVGCLKNEKIKGGIYKSFDSGNNWQLINDEIDDVYQMIFNPIEPDIVYLACGDNGIYKSLDNGKTWIEKNNGLKIGRFSNIKLKDIKVISLAVDLNNPKIIYAGSGFSQGQIYKSIDSGESWINLTKDVNNIYPDGWWIQKVNYPGGNNYAASSLSIDPFNSNRIFVSGRSGIWRSDDGGITWHSKVNGLEATCMTQINFVPKDPNVLFIANNDWVFFKSIDGGKNFQRNLKGIGNWDLDINKNIWRKYKVKNSRNFAIDTTTFPITVYLGGSASEINSGTIFKSIDGGENWNEVNKDLPIATVTALAINPENSNILFAALKETGLYKTINKGESWIKIDININNNMIFKMNNNIIVIHPKFTKIIYILDKGNGIYKTEDDGKTWEIISKKLPQFGINGMDQFVGGIDVDPNDPNIVYVGLKKYGVYKTFDGGKNWEQITPYYIYNGGAISIDPNDGAIYLASVPSVADEDIKEFIPGIYKSIDNGKTWFPIHNDNLLNISLKVTSLALDPNKKGVIYLTTQGNGIIIGELKERNE